jgi:MFS family permease
VRGEGQATSRVAALRAAVTSPRLRRPLLAYTAFSVTECCFWIAPLVWAYGVGGVRATSLMSVVELAPTALLAPVVARWCDRTTRPRALMVGYLAQLLTLTVLGLTMLTAADVVVFATAALACVANSATRPVHYAILPDIAETTEQLTASNALSSGSESVAAFLGPLLAGLLMVPWGPGGVVLASAAFIGVAALLVAKPVSAAGRPPAARSEEAPHWRGLLADPFSRLFGGLTLAAYVLLGALDILLVVLALDLLGMGRSGPGLLNSAAGVGGLVGTAATVLLVGLPRLTPAIVVGAVVAGVPIVLAGLSHSEALVVVLVAVSGGGRLFHGVAAFTLLQRSVADRMLVTVFGLLESTMSAGMALGAVLAPVLISLTGTTTAFAVTGLLLPVVVIAGIPGLRRADAASEVTLEDVARLRSVPFLGLLTPLVLERLVRHQGRVSQPADSVLVHEGETGEDFYVVRSGRLEVSHAGGAVLRELGPGDWFGEVALLRQVPRTASVRATTDVELVTIGRDAFLGAVAGAAPSVEAARQAAATYADLPSDDATGT